MRWSSYEGGREGGREGEEEGGGRQRREGALLLTGQALYNSSTLVSLSQSVGRRTHLHIPLTLLSGSSLRAGAPEWVSFSTNDRSSCRRERSMTSADVAVWQLRM